MEQATEMEEKPFKSSWYLSSGHTLIIKMCRPSKIYPSRDTVALGGLQLISK
jgi:hypothetical protein